MRTPVLADHRKVRSTLVTPFNHLLGPTRDVSWVNTMIPELLWIALLHEVHGDRRAVEIVTAFTRDVRAHSASSSDQVWAAAGRFAAFPGGALQAILSSAGYARDLRSALAPIASCYPEHPLNAIHVDRVPEPSPAMLAWLRRTVSDLYDRSDRGAVMVQATAVWIAFDSDKLKVASHLSLANFPRIEDYPDTELSRQIGASIRATLNHMFGEGQMMASDGTWPVAFWNRGLRLQPCEVLGG